MKKDHIIFLIGRIQYKANRFLSQEMKAHGIKGLAQRKQCGEREPDGQQRHDVAHLGQRAFAHVRNR